MDIVRYKSQERVDLPDITQMSFLVLGEFRRLARFLTGGNIAKVVRGFGTTPADTPDATVTVTMDPGGGDPIGMFVGPENIEGAGLEYGQIAGDKKSDGLLEGPAQQVLDFTGQPADTYTVEIKFVYTDGSNDNRAFWDEGADSEFIDSLNTRHKAQWTAQFVSGTTGTGDEWIKIAEVDWDGSTVEAEDITDKRDFLFEGSAPFQQANRGDSGGVPDFDRSTDRAADGVNEVYDIIRALARQVRDIKGPNDADDLWDWFSEIPETYTLRALKDRLDSITSEDDTVSLGETLIGSGADRRKARITAHFEENEDFTLLFEGKPHAGGSFLERFRIYTDHSSGSPAYWFTWNAKWDGSQWTKDDSGAHATATKHRSTIVLFSQDSSSSSTWTTWDRETLVYSHAGPTYKLVATQVFTSDDTYSRSSSFVRAKRVRLVGGGGGGGGADTNDGAASGGGGGGGGYSELWIEDDATSIAVDVGQGGDGATGDGPSQNGGDSSFGSYITVEGGKGGLSVTGDSSVQVGEGGNGGAASGGDVNIPGQDGQSGYSRDDFDSIIRGIGGGSHLGPATFPTIDASADGDGTNGVGYGSGGAPGWGASIGTHDGGNGADGIVIVEEYV